MEDFTISPAQAIVLAPLLQKLSGMTARPDGAMASANWSFASPRVPSGIRSDSESDQVGMFSPVGSDSSMSPRSSRSVCHVVSYFFFFGGWRWKTNSNLGQFS